MGSTHFPYNHVRVHFGKWVDPMCGRAHRVAMKEVCLKRAEREPVSKDAAARLLHEANILTLADGHDNILRCFGYCDGSEDNLLRLVVEECACGSLVDLITRKDADLKLNWLRCLRDIAAAMSHLHS